MEQAVIDGKASFSRSGAVSKNVNWLSLLVPNDAKLIQQYLEDFEKSNFIPKSLEQFDSNSQYFADRYNASIKWINEKNHAIISNGPFALKSYSPESRTITINAFADQSYPFEAGYWEEFEKITFPKIIDVKMAEVIAKGEPTTISITTESASKIQFFLTNSDGMLVSNGVKDVTENPTVLEFDDEITRQLSSGANDLKIFAMSDTVLRPDIYVTSFLVVDGKIDGLPQVDVVPHDRVVEEANYYAIIALGIVITIIAVAVFLRKRLKISQI
jgi:peptide/nickel transport system substrate-binding protein